MFGVRARHGEQNGGRRSLTHHLELIVAGECSGACSRTERKRRIFSSTLPSKLIEWPNGNADGHRSGTGNVCWDLSHPTRRHEQVYSMSREARWNLMGHGMQAEDWRACRQGSHGKEAGLIAAHKVRH